MIKENTISLTKKSSNIYKQSIVSLLSQQSVQIREYLFDYDINDVKTNLEYKKLDEELKKSNFYQDISLNEVIVNNYIKTIMENGGSIINNTKDIISYINSYNKNYEYKELDNLIIKSKYQFDIFSTDYKQDIYYTYENNKLNKLNNKDIKKSNCTVPVQYYIYISNKDIFLKYVKSNLINLENNKITINNPINNHKNIDKNFTSFNYLDKKKDYKKNTEYIIFNDCDLLNSILINILTTNFDDNYFNFINNIKKEPDLMNIFTNKLILNKNLENFLENPNSLLNINLMLNYESTNYLEKLDFCEKILGKKYLTIELSKIIFNIHQITNLFNLDDIYLIDKDNYKTTTANYLEEIKKDIINLSKFDNKYKQECAEIIFQTLNNSIGEILSNKTYIEYDDTIKLDETIKESKELFMSFFDIIDLFELSNDEKINYNKIFLQNIKLELAHSFSKDVYLNFDYNLGVIINPKDNNNSFYDDNDVDIYYKVNSVLEKECLLLDNLFSSKIHNDNVIKENTSIKVKPKFKI